MKKVYVFKDFFYKSYDSAKDAVLNYANETYDEFKNIIDNIAFSVYAKMLICEIKEVKLDYRVTSSNFFIMYDR